MKTHCEKRERRGRREGERMEEEKGERRRRGEEGEGGQEREGEMKETDKRRNVREQEISYYREMVHTDKWLLAYIAPSSLRTSG